MVADGWNTRFQRKVRVRHPNRDAQWAEGSWERLKLETKTQEPLPERQCLQLRDVERLQAGERGRTRSWHFHCPEVKKNGGPSKED